jgi:catechol-2,3-dioxygenase
LTQLRNERFSCVVYKLEAYVNFLEVRLATDRLAGIRDFYVNTLGFPLLDETRDSLTVGAGETRLVFERGNAALYHVAFNIPENQFADAKRWVMEHVPLLRIQEKDEIHWSAWNAHALYFFDPAGNIMEFIARHNLPNAASEPFNSRSIRQVSEIGLAVTNVRQAAETLQSELRVGVFDAGDGETFTALGDDYGLFIIVRQGRAWFPTSDQLADLYPMGVTLRGAIDKRLTLPELPYRIDVKQTIYAR